MARAIAVAVALHRAADCRASASTRMNVQKNSMRGQPRWFVPAWWPILAGIAWLGSGWCSGIGAGLIASVPGALLLASGVALLLWPGDRQISHYMALGGVLSVLLAVPLILLDGVLPGIVLGVLGAGGFVTAGYAALYQAVTAPGVPRPEINRKTAAKAAMDEALLAYFVASARVPTGERAAADADEMIAARACIREHGWSQSPERLHTPPSAPQAAALGARRAAGRRFLHLRFASDYQPHPELPGGQRWLAHQANQNVHAWVFRHTDHPRPWILGIHGYQMGTPQIDFSLFQIDWLHHELGCNVVLPVLPLHGPRKAYARSGRGYLDGYVCDLLHAEIQAVRDLRRTLAWIRQQQAEPSIGVLGFSLGGYNAALLAALEADLQCVVAGIPMTDAPETVLRHLPELHRNYLISCGLTPEVAAEVMGPVSPLQLPPRVPHDRRFIVAAAGDQLVPPTQPARLFEHWRQPSMHWYQGAHLSVRREAGVKSFIDNALRQSGVCSSGGFVDACLQTQEVGK